MTVKNYTSSPLPFMGQKRRFVGEFKKAIEQFPNDTIFIDLFGGSGLLSHIVKQERPDARVIYNDFDDFNSRLEKIPMTNSLLADIRNLIGGGIAKSARLSEDMKQRILSRIKVDDTAGFADYITLSGSLMFSGKYVTSYSELAKETFYQNIRQSDYNADGYLDGVEVVRCDYQNLFNSFKNTHGVVFLVDPPYLSTEVNAYKCYWRLADYLNVLKVIEGQSYIYFTSSKSQIIELIDWFARTKFDTNPFENAKRREFNVTINKNANYTDIMLYKSRSKE